MSFEWNTAYQFGDLELDESQNKLFQLANQLSDIDDWMALRPIIVSLYKQMRSHFALEEAFMQRSAYPDLGLHAERHKDLLSRLEDRSMDVGKGHMNKKAIVAVMSDWAEQHVTTDDLPLIQFLTKAA